MDTQLVRIDSKPPDRSMTIAEWCAWREAENKRLVEEITNLITIDALMQRAGGMAELIRRADEG